MTVDLFTNHKAILVDPVGEGFAITPNSNSYFTYATRKVYVGQAGNVALELKSPLTHSNTVVMFYNVPVGTMLDVRAVRCLDNTTAGNLLGLF